MWAVRAHASAAQGYETRYYESAAILIMAAGDGGKRVS